MWGAHQRCANQPSILPPSQQRKGRGKACVLAAHPLAAHVYACRHAAIQRWHHAVQMHATCTCLTSVHSRQTKGQGQGLKKEGTKTGLHKPPSLYSPHGIQRRCKCLGAEQRTRLGETNRWLQHTRSCACVCSGRGAPGAGGSATVQPQPPSRLHSCRVGAHFAVHVRSVREV